MIKSILEIFLSILTFNFQILIEITKLITLYLLYILINNLLKNN